MAENLPDYWDSRTPLNITFPRLLQLYQDLNDAPIRGLLAEYEAGGWHTVDLGCGSGRFLHYAIVGLDFSLGMLERAKSQGQDLVRGSLLALPFRDEAFDFAFSVDVFFHLQNPIEALKEALRVSSRKPLIITHPRTLFLFFLMRLRWIHPRRLVPYLSLLLAFPLDRLFFARLASHHSGKWGDLMEELKPDSPRSSPIDSCSSR